MKIRIERDALADALAWTTRSLGTRALGGHQGVGIEARGGKVIFTAFDRDTSAQAEFETVVEEEGHCILPGRLLADITKTLPAAPVVLELSDATVDITCGRSAFSVQVLNVGEFPRMINLPEAIGTVDASAFAEAVGQVHIAAGSVDALAHLSGVRLEFNDGNLTLAATDRFRLAIRELDWQPALSEVSTSALPPAIKLSEIARGLADCERIEIALSAHGTANVIGFSGMSKSGAYRSIVTTLLDQNFPPKYRELIPKENQVTAYVSTQDLVAAVKRVRLVLEHQASIAMQPEGSELHLVARSKETHAQANEVLSAQVIGTIERMQFNPNFLIDGLNAVGTPYVRLGFTLASKPMVIAGAAEIGADPDLDYQYLLMPMKTAN